MALDNTRWGDNVAAAVQAAAATEVPQDAFITTGQLENIWRIICGEHVGEITTNAEVDSDGSTDTGPAGGPLPINDLPGVIS